MTIDGIKSKYTKTKDGRVILSGKAYRDLCYEVWLRDGRQCIDCGTPLAVFSTILIDHIQKRKMGGGWRNDVEENLRTLCLDCHYKRDFKLKPRRNAEKWSKDY